MNDFVAETPSGSFSPVGESSVPVFDSGNLKSAIDQLVQRFSAALNLGQDEVENAKVAANGALCSDGYDADATAANFLRAEQDLYKNLDALVGSEGMSTGFPKDFSPGGRAGLARDLRGTCGVRMGTADAPTNNQDSYEGWAKVRADLDGVIEDSRSTGTGSWQSEAGDAYRQDAASRTAEAVSLQSLAANSRDALEALVTVQTTIVDVIVEEFNSRLEACASNADIMRTAKTIDEFKNDINSIVSETVGDSMCLISSSTPEAVPWMLMSGNSSLS